MGSPKENYKEDSGVGEIAQVQSAGHLKNEDLNLMLRTHMKAPTCRCAFATLELEREAEIGRSLRFCGHPGEQSQYQ